MLNSTLEEYSTKTEIPLHKDIRFHPSLTFGEKMFYAEIKSMSNRKICPFSSKKLGELFGVSHQTILNWVNKLIELDLLELGVDYKTQKYRQFIRAKK